MNTFNYTDFFCCIKINRQFFHRIFQQVKLKYNINFQYVKVRQKTCTSARTCQNKLHSKLANYIVHSTEVLQNVYVTKYLVKSSFQSIFFERSFLVHQSWIETLQMYQNMQNLNKAVLFVHSTDALYNLYVTKILVKSSFKSTF